MQSKVYICGYLLAGIAGFEYCGEHGCVCCDCCVLSGIGLCDGLIIHPEKS
jgi:hypothetical protein